MTPIYHRISESPAEQNPDPIQELTYCLVHGAYHGAWCWELMTPIIWQAGHRTLTPDLPIDDPDVRFNDLADIVAESITDEKNTVMVLSSRAANYGPLVAQRLPSLLHLVYIDPGFETNNNQQFPKPHFGLSEVPKKYSQGYAQAIRRFDHNERLTVFDPDKAIEFFYHDCLESVGLKSVARLRPQYRHDEAPISYWPDRPRTVFIMKESKVINPKYVNHVAKCWLGVKAIEMSGGHMPMLSRPAELFQIMHNAVTSKIPKKDHQGKNQSAVNK